MKTIAQKVGSVIFCLLQILVGILLLINPVSFTMGIFILISSVLIVFGIVCVVNYFRTPIDVASKEQYLTKGLIALLIGAFGIFCNDWLIAALPLLTVAYGILMLVIGIGKIQFTVDAIRTKQKRWFLGIISAVISIACAAVILSNPFTTTAVLWMFTGISIIVDAIFDIFAIIFGKSNKDTKDSNT